MAEEYDLETFCNIQAFVSASFRAFGFSWQHQRVQNFLQRVSQSAGHPVDRHCLPYRYYCTLAMEMAALVVDERSDAIAEVYQLEHARKLLTKLDHQHLLKEHDHANA